MLLRPMCIYNLLHRSAKCADRRITSLSCLMAVFRRWKPTITTALSSLRGRVFPPRRATCSMWHGRLQDGFRSSASVWDTKPSPRYSARLLPGTIPKACICPVGLCRIVQPAFILYHKTEPKMLLNLLVLHLILKKYICNIYKFIYVS